MTKRIVSTKERVNSWILVCLDPIVPFEEPIFSEGARGQGAVVLPAPPCMWIYRF